MLPKKNILFYVTRFLIFLVDFYASKDNSIEFVIVINHNYNLQSYTDNKYRIEMQIAVNYNRVLYFIRVLSVFNT